MPAWVSYVEMVKLAGGTVVSVDADITQDFKITPDQLEKAITPATRMLLLCSPSNPTGSVYSREELQAIVDVLAKHPDVMVLADEIYEHINFTGSFTSMAAFHEIAARVILINGVSKAYAMTGWRIGYCAAPLWLAKAVTKLQGQYTSNASSIAQKAAEAAYTGSQECVAEMNEAFRRRRDLVVELASDIPGLKVNRPQGAFYLFPEVSAYIGKTTPEGKKIERSADLAMYLLESGHVATVDGGAFGMEGYIRLSYATSDDNIREALRRMKEALLALK
ncbi:MAG: pyridoxal phosphate-dependent aminotransferase, partial [Duncaniella sp.]|nr:pyridoxal phosphate-dependent aminotransferase [Duncaniella sp.]